MKKKIIELQDIDPVKFATVTKEFDEGYRLFMAMSERERSLISTMLYDIVMAQVDVGLGLVEWDSDEPIPNLALFDAIQDKYDCAGEDCYFCSNATDSSEPFVVGESTMCVEHMRKICQFLKAVKVPAEKIFPGSAMPWEKKGV